MYQIVYEYDEPWPDNGPFHLEKQIVSQEIAVSPVVARRRANGFLAGYVTMMVTAGQPMLILGENPAWHVPAVLCLPGVGEVGTVGHLDIDAQSGEIILPSDEQIAQMQEVAHAIAAHFALSPTPAK
jgi:hypothetical protein